MEKSNKLTFIGSALAFLGVFMFSSKAILVKLIYALGVDSITTLALRMIFSLPVYVLIWIISSAKQKGSNPRSVTSLFPVIPLGFIGYYMASFLDFQGLQYVDASLERLIVFIYPTIVLILGFAFFGKKIKRNQIIAIIISYLGILFAFANKLDFAVQNDVLKGSILVFASTVCYAIYLVYCEKHLDKLGPITFTSLSMIVSCIAVLVHYSLMHEFELFQHNYQVYLYSFFMAIFCTVIPSYLLSYSIKLIGATNMAIIGSVGPVSTIMLAVIFLNEIINTNQIIGTILVIAGVLFLKTKKNKIKISNNLAISKNS